MPLLLQSGQTENIPANVEAEKTILGCILIDGGKGNTEAFDQAAEVLKSEDFFVAGHRQMFRWMIEMAEEQVPIDTVSLAEMLVAAGELQAIGGATYLASLTDGAAWTTNIQQYAKIVKDKAVLREIIHISRNVEARCMEGSEDPADVLAEIQERASALGDRVARGKLLQFKQAFEERVGHLDNLQPGHGEEMNGVKTGFSEIDDMTGGFRPSELIIIAARPGTGKTSWMLDVARDATYRQHLSVAIFSLEMSTEALLVRALCAHADVNAHRLRVGFGTHQDWAKLAYAYAAYADLPFYIDDTPGLTVIEMRSKARRVKSSVGLHLIAVDYLQLVSSYSRQNSRQEEVAATARGLKGLAKELGVPVIALSQLRRPRDGSVGPPQLHDLRESGEIEQIADTVTMLYREEMHKMTEENRGRADGIIAKQRNGPVGTAHMIFLPEYSSFRNPASSFENPPPQESFVE